MEKLDNRIDKFFSGLFWVFCGVFLLIGNLLGGDEFSGFRDIIQYWSLLFLGLYLIIFTLLSYMRKLYFILGVIFFAIWIAKIINKYISDYKIIVPIIMMIISVGVIICGIFFTRTSKHLQYQNGRTLRYVVVGIYLLIFSALILFSVLNKFEMSLLLQKISPIFIVFLGCIRIQQGIMSSKNKKSDLQNENKSNVLQHTKTLDRKNKEHTSSEKQSKDDVNLKSSSQKNAKKKL